MIEPEIGAYIRGFFIQSLVIALILGIGLWVIGSPYPALLALIGILSSPIPVVGAFFLAMIVLLMGLTTSVPFGWLTALFAIIILVIFSIWVKPKILKSKWKNHILTLVIIVALADVFGIVGIIAAPILSLILQIIWSRLVSHRQIVGAAEQISDIKGRQKQLQEEVKTLKEPYLPLIKIALERLDNLILQAEPILESASGLSLSETNMNKQIVNIKPDEELNN